MDAAAADRPRSSPSAAGHDTEPTELHYAEDRRSAVARFWGIAKGYFKSTERRTAWALAIGLAVLVVMQIVIQVLLNLWNGQLFNAIDQRDTNQLWRLIAVFCVLAGGSLAVAALQIYTKMRLQLDWRTWITQRLLGEWLYRGRHYQLRFTEGDHDNPDQRIAENVRLVTEAAVDFASGLLTSTLLMASFATILWGLSGTLDLAIGGTTLHIPGYLLWAAVIYAVAGTSLTYYLGNPLVAANETKLSREADFRYNLVRVTENSEGIALSRGDDDERRALLDTLREVAGAWSLLRRHTTNLTYMTAGYAVVATMFPILVAAPAYFSGQITLGNLMQGAAAFLQVQVALSWFVDNFPRYADWKASVDRVHNFIGALSDLIEEIEDTDENTITLTLTDGEADSLVLRNIEIAHPDGTVVVGNASATFAKGQRVLIIGESGTGKSTLFRAMAGLWPWGRGEIVLPSKARLMFLPQRSYLPLGTLRETLCYPGGTESYADETLIAALERCGLERLAGALDDNERWDRVLSGGEQQRLAFARVLIQRPDWVLMDEATSALDEAGQQDMLSLFQNELKGMGVISIGHRPGLENFHDQTLVLVKGDEGARLVRQARFLREQRRTARAEALAQRQPLIKRIKLVRLSRLADRGRRDDAS